MTYSTKTPGIGGSIKRRYADFLVEELSENHECRVEYFKDEEAGQKMELSWPEKPEGKDQLILEMEKFNTDTHSAIRRITRWQQVSQKRIGFAGMKDKRAITSQRISIWQPDLEKLKHFKARSVFLKPLGWEAERIELGDLKGNRFTTVIREIELNEKELKSRIENCLQEMKKGIANFFGEQRFGGIRGVTHLVGRELVNNNLEAATLTYLTFTNPREKPEIKKARTNLAQTKDFSTASKEFPVECRFERSLIHHLCKLPQDFAGAWRKMPKNLRFLFTHAFQSYLFNQIIEERLKQGFGLGPIEGDILEDGIPTAPLFGFQSELATGKAGEIERAVLEKEGLSLSDFKIKVMPEMSSKGLRKKIVLMPQDLKFEGIAPDEFNEGKLKATISFVLEKGTYATVVLGELTKSNA